MSLSIHLRAPLFSATAKNNSTEIKPKSETNDGSSTVPPPTTSHTPTLLTPLPRSSEQNPNLPNLPTTNQLLGKWHVTHSTLPMWKDKRNVNITYGLLPPLAVSNPSGSKGTVETELELTRLDDTVCYQKKKTKKKQALDASSGGSGGGAVSMVRGIDTAVRELPIGATTTTTTTTNTAAATAAGTTDAPSLAELEPEPENNMRWRWKGTGVLTRWFSSEWEVLGFGADDDDDDDDEENGSGDKGHRDRHGDGYSDARNYWVVTYFSKTLVTPTGIDILSRRPAGPTERTVRRIREALREVPDEDVRRLEGLIFEVENEAETED